MAPRDERVHPESEFNRYQPADYHPQDHRKPRMKVHPGQFGHQSPRPESSGYGRDLGRCHSSSADNKTYRQSLVARKSARTGSQPTRYGHGRPRDPIKPKTTDKPYHNPKESTYLNMSSLEKSPPRRPSLNRRSIHKADTRNKREANDKTRRKKDDYLSLGKKSRVENPMDKQVRGRVEDSNPRLLALETHSSEPTKGDDFDGNIRSRSPMAIDVLGSVGKYHLRNDGPVAQAEPPPSRLNRAPGSNLEYLLHSPEGHYTIESQYRTLSAPAQPALPGETPSQQRQSPPRLRLAALSPHIGSNDTSLGSAAHGKPSDGIDIVTPISTSAMSISSGSTPSQPSSSSRKNPHHRKFVHCIKCKKSGTQMVDILIRCTECHTSYHTSCHEPKISLNRQGKVDGVETWKCQRCIVRSRQLSDISTSMGKSSNSATSSEISSASSENSTAQISQGIIELTLYAGKSELNGNISGQDIDPNEDDHFDSDVGHPRKRLKSSTPAQSHWNGTLRSADTVGTYKKIFERSEYEELSRSSFIFSGNRTIAVVIGNQPRSASTSTNGRNIYQDTKDWPEIPTIKDSQETPEWTTSIQYRANLHHTSPTAFYGNNQPAVICPDDDQISNTQKRTHPTLLQEIKDSQEIEEELTDAPMSLDSPDVYSPVQEDYSMPSAAWENPEAHWKSPREETRTYGRPETLHGKNSPQYPPSVGDRGKDENGEQSNRECRDISSPPYSPPPPDISEPVDPPYISLPQVTLQGEQPVNDEFYCKKCTFYVANNGQYKDKLCGSCDILLRNTHPIPSLKLSHTTARPTQPPVPTPKQSVWNHRHQHSGTPKQASPRISNSPDPSVASKCGEASKGLGSGEVPLVDPMSPPARKFQTSKDMVIERYQMKFIGTPEPVTKPKPRVTTTQNKRKREEPVKPAPGQQICVSEISDKRGKVKAIAATDEPRKPWGSSNLTGPARKFPSKPASLDISPSPRSLMSTNVDRLMARDDGTPPKRTERRGPAMKSAGRPIRIPVPDSDESDEKDSGDRLKELERKLQEQKGYTKKQMEKAVKLQNKLMEAEREKREIQEKLDIALAANRKPTGSTSPKQARKAKKLKRRIQLDRNDEIEECDNPVQFTTGSHAIDPQKGPSLKELYKDYKFTASVPWFCPPEIPAPDPSTFRKPGWRKPQERAPGYDDRRKMKVHLHRQLTRDNWQPLKITAEQSFDPNSHHLENSRGASLDDDCGDEFDWPLGGRETTIDDFMGFPDNMVPAVKDGILGFRPGIINQRTRRLDRNVQHYRIRAPGVLMDRI